VDVTDRRIERGVSTVLDVALCLVLVTAAVLTVAGVQQPQPDPSARAAGETATALSTTTATVSYSLSGVAGASSTPEFPRTRGPGFERHAHGTLASLLARAALANLSVGGDPVSRLGGPFGEAVRAAVAPQLVGARWRGQVVARWEPFPGASMRAAFSVGSEPPPDAAVHVATLAIPSGVEPPFTPVHRAADGGFVELGRAVASAVVWSRFPPGRTRQALQGAYPEPRLTELRYRRLASRFGTTVGQQVRADAPTDANERLAAAMVGGISDRLRTRFDDPAAAAAAIELGTITVVVRTWSP
jgi:hypothetical protein